MALSGLGNLVSTQLRNEFGCSIGEAIRVVATPRVPIAGLPHISENPVYRSIGKLFCVVGLSAKYVEC
jgi:hypothetical protein